MWHRVVPLPHSPQSLHAGQISGIEVAVHVVCTLFQREALRLLVVDISSIFNSLNRQSQTALRNIQRLCPSVAAAFINTYRDSQCASML